MSIQVGVPASNAESLFSRYRCERCQKQHKKCDQARPACDRCTKAKVACIYKDTDTLSRIIDASESPQSLFDFKGGRKHASTSLPLLDPDFIPTYDDYMLVKRLLLSDRFDFSEVLFPYSLDVFLDQFFLLSPYLRASVCALAASLLQDELCDLLLAKYFRQAKKFVSQSIEKMTLDMLQAIRIMGWLANNTGQTEYCLLLFEIEIHLNFQLQLYVDPDNPKSLYRQASLAQKEWQRYVFHMAASYQKGIIPVFLRSGDSPHHPDLKLCGMATPSISKVFFDIGRVKLPMRLENTGFIELSQSGDLLLQLKELFKKPPATVQDIYLSPQIKHLTAESMQFVSKLPLNHLLASEIDGYERFRHQQMQETSWVHFFGRMQLSIRSLTLLCMLHRPRVYLLAHLLEESSFLADTFVANHLLVSLKVASDAAQRIGNLVSFMLQSIADPTITGGKNGGTSSGVKLSADSFVHSFWGLDVFDAAIMLWFILCRMPMSWRARISFDVAKAQQSLLSILQFVQLVDSNMKSGAKTSNESISPSALNPIMLCVNSFVLEVQGFSCDNLGIHPLELAMTVISVSDDSDDLESIARGKEPLAYLGLLGVSVMGGVQWSSPTESNWAVFWRNVQLLK
ncbi:hypothetical protein BC830DRAFT_1127284 [Chytriomyces sp. MP71]|nr:hypothetical protein BC830DRAFT_1127284 [Chytriomyces sp. MP71]